MTRFFSCSTRFTAALLALVTILSREAIAATPKEVDDALNKAKTFVYAQQRDGNWEIAPGREGKAHAYSVVGGQWGGLTAVTTYAMLASGEDSHDPRMVAAIDWLKKADIIGIYALGFRAQIWPMLPPSEENKAMARADFQKLYKGLNRAGKATSLYNYFYNKLDPNQVDHSVSQLGVLGVWAAAQMGIEVSDTYWERVERRWIADQKPDGGWTYDQNPRIDPNPEHNREQASMTAAGVATLFITQDYSLASSGARCNGNIQNASIDKGLVWLANNLSDWTTPIRIGGTRMDYYLPGYTLWGIERVGVASGLKYFGTVDWYQFGADWCVKNQARDGSWGGTGSFPNTALCMLFLAHGRAPVLVNKLQYAWAPEGAEPPKPGEKVKTGHWNQRPRDVANFTRWMGKQIERSLNWQITNLDTPADELSDAPFLYLSGNEPVTFTKEQKDKLRLYVQRGGMILANGDCAAATGENSFIGAMTKLGAELFPDCGEFRELPASHPIYTREQYSPKAWKSKFRIRGITNGVREFMLLLPDDPAKAWQLRETVGPGREESYQAMANIIIYGTDKQSLRAKGESLLVKPDPAMQPTQTIKVARLKYAGPWNPEPAGWPRLAAIMHNRNKVDLDIKEVDLGKAPLTDFKIANLTGTTKFTLTADQKSALKKFVENGGTLLVDAAGGSSDFAGSAEALLEELFPKKTRDVLPPTDGAFSAAKTKLEVLYRPFAKEALGKINVPQVRGITLNGRTAVYYSREDLTGGLVGQPVDGILGYTPESAVTITSGVVLQASGAK